MYIKFLPKQLGTAKVIVNAYKYLNLIIFYQKSCKIITLKNYSFIGIKYFGI